MKPRTGPRFDRSRSLSSAASSSGRLLLALCTSSGYRGGQGRRLVPRGLVMLLLVLLSLHMTIITRVAVNARVYPLNLTMSASDMGGAAVGTQVIFAGGQATILAFSASVVTFNASATTPALKPLQSLVFSRGNFATAVCGDEVFFVGGRGGSITNTTAQNYVDIYNLTDYAHNNSVLPVAKYTSLFGSMGGPWNTWAVFPGGYDSSGALSDTIKITNQSPFSVTNLALRPTPADDFPAISFFSQGHYLTLFAGGSTNASFTPTKETLLFNHTTGNMSSTVMSLSVARGWSTAAVTQNESHVLIIGGTSQLKGVWQCYKTIDVFDTQNLALVFNLNLTTCRHSHASGTVGPYIYVIGGVTGTGTSLPSTCLSSVEIIDSRDWTVFPGGDLSLPLAAMAAVTVPGIGVFTGGGLSNMASASGQTNAIQIFSCGNGVLEAAEVCDLGVGCFKNCTGCLSGYVQCGAPDCCSTSPTPTPGVTPTQTPTPRSTPTPTPPPLAAPSSTPTSTPISPPITTPFVAPQPSPGLLPTPDPSPTLMPAPLVTPLQTPTPTSMVSSSIPPSSFTPSPSLAPTFIPVPTPVLVLCLPPAPGIGFICNNGNWTFPQLPNGTLVLPQLVEFGEITINRSLIVVNASTIRSSSLSVSVDFVITSPVLNLENATVNIQGNLIIERNSVLEVSRLINSSITISGCIETDGAFAINISGAKAGEYSNILFNNPNNNCNTDFSTVKVNLIVDDGCYKAQLQSVERRLSEAIANYGVVDICHISMGPDMSPFGFGLLLGVLSSLCSLY